MSEVDVERRFGGVSRLYGASGLVKLQAAHVAVIGIGGVGSWAAEALARNAVGVITLIDLDNIAESNVNRQIHALEGEFGKAKVTAMAERIRAINPQAQVHEIEDFVTPENINDALGGNIHAASGAPQIIIDATDDVKAKIAMAVFCKQRDIPLIMAGGAGGRLDATKIKVADLSAVQGDKLLAKVRNLLRRDYDFPKASNNKKSAKFDIQAVYSDEQVIKPNAINSQIDATGFKHSSASLQANIHAGAGDACLSENNTNDSITGLNCAGYGSSVCVTAPFGFTAAGLAIQQLLMT
jgi:tRNA threonylcarbamoyladenosine dehydratase